ncbi:hypothetical protein PIB30_051638 [Stylosanthes scabra]|uniref:Leucine-rich repeat-containing N-terminal plant-type domain-containing protein n=1 Tax=Stylosanthes scabra TaxID=79078 RepID=A0ABU6UHD7_9FABA|nr:hypothetical protein [Stylosanthes scabra]
MAQPQPTLKSITLVGYAAFIFFFFFIRVMSNNNDGISNEEASYLLKLRDALHNLPSNWFHNNPSMCSWTGVVCSSSQGPNSRYVEKISLTSMELKGTVPSGLNESLVFLTYLNLANNSLSGPLPSLASLSSLQYVDLSSNNFTSIPHACFQGLYSLEELALNDNTNLPRWTFPTDLNISSRLNYLQLSATNLMGSLPDTFDSFPILELLYLFGNYLTGVLPKSFEQLVRLKILVLSGQKENHKFSGTIEALSSMPLLSAVDLEGNSFGGSLPDLSNHIYLEALLIANNQLTGVVPPSLFQGSHIKRVTLENNLFQGPFPLFNKTMLDVSLGGTGFCLDHPGPCDHRVNTLLQVAEAFGYPFLLAKSWQGNNPCQGSIPESLTTLQHLKILDVSNNNLSGNIPPFSDKIKLITSGNAFLGKSQTQPTVSDNRPSAPAPKTLFSSTSIVGISIAGVGVIVIFVVAIAYNHKKRFNLVQWITLKKETSLDHQIEELIKSYGTSTPMRYTYAEVKQMTNSFHEKLGQGGYSIVYKASLNDGRQYCGNVDNFNTKSIL